VTPAFVVAPPNARIRFHALATSLDGEPLVLREGASWTAGTGTIFGETTGSSVELDVGAPRTAPVTAVEATIGAAHCSAKVLVIPSAPANKVQIAAIDEGSGRPISGAIVVLSSATGALLEQATTDTNGLAVVSPTEPRSTISVFHVDFSYRTVANFPESERTIFFPLRRNPADRFGGAISIVTPPLTSNVHLARVGFSAEPLESEFTDEVEPTVLTNTSVTGLLGGMSGAVDTPVPVGTLLGWGGMTIKPTATSTTSSGVCSDDRATAEGTCGTSSAWALTLDLALGDFYRRDDETSSLLEVLNRISGANVRTFTSSVLRDFSVTLGPAQLDAGTPDFTDTTGFTGANHNFTQAPMSLAFVAKLPELPRYRDHVVEQALAVGAAQVPGRGIIPIGLGVWSSAPRVNTIYPQGGFAGVELPTGQLGLRIAPPHHGLEGQPTALYSQMLSEQWKVDAAAGRASSTIVTSLPSVLAFDPSTPQIDQSAQAFPAMVEGRFDFGARTYSAEPVSDVSALVITFTDQLASRWEIVVDPADPNFTLPDVPGVLRDRLFFGGNRVMGLRSLQRVKALRFAGEDFTAVVQRHSALRPISALTAWSQVDVRPLALSFKAPQQPITPRGSRIVVHTEGFRSGVDGFVPLRVEGTGCSLMFDLEELVVPSWELENPRDLEFTLPMACVGTVSLHAELVDLQRRPLVPPVEVNLSVEIN
jgi:hypothetical protein